MGPRRPVPNNAGSARSDTRMRISVPPSQLKGTKIQAVGRWPRWGGSLGAGVHTWQAVCRSPARPADGGRTGQFSVGTEARLGGGSARAERLADDTRRLEDLGGLRCRIGTGGGTNVSAPVTAVSTQKVKISPTCPESSASPSKCWAGNSKVGSRAGPPMHTPRTTRRKIDRARAVCRLTCAS